MYRQGFWLYRGISKEMSLPGKKIAVIGLGYVGLALAALCAKKGYQVVGLDANEQVVSIVI